MKFIGGIIGGILGGAAVIAGKCCDLTISDGETYIIISLVALTGAYYLSD